MLTGLFFEESWPLVALMMAGAVVLLGLWWRRRQRRWLIAALVALLLAPGFWALARLVQTDRERIADLSAVLVRSTVGPDMAAFDAVVDPAATLTGPRGEAWVGPGQLRALAELALRRHRPTGHTLREVAVELDERGRRLARSRIEVTTTLSSDPTTAVPTAWVLTWSERDGRWVITDIRWVRIWTQEPGLGMLN